MGIIQSDEPPPELKSPKGDFYFCPCPPTEVTSSKNAGAQEFRRREIQQNRDDFIAAVKATQTNGL